MQPITRRDLLGVLGAAAGGSSLAGCGQHEDPFALPKPDVPGASRWRRGEERRIATACGQCAAGCGVHVRVVEGRAVKLEGHTACPVNRGGIGPRGLASTQVLYDPDRIRQPLVRRARGAALEPIAWDEAIALLAERLRSLRERGESHRTAIVCGRQRGMMLELLQRFARAYGTPNVFDGFCTADAAVSAALRWMQGVREVPAYDWTSARYVLSLGSGLLDSSCQLVHFARAQALMRRGQPTSRARIVHAGISHSRTAMNADEFLPVRPGSYAALALGLAHVLVREGLHDAEFVSEHAFGFEPFTGADGVEHAGFRAALERWTPEVAAQACGLSAADIERLARDLAAQRPAFAIAGSEELDATNGVATAMAVHALNALLGAIDRPGGLLLQRAAPLAEWPELELDEAAETGLAQPRLDGAGGARFPFAGAVLDALPEAVLAGAPYALDTLLFYYSNPLHARAEPRRWREALAAVPFVATFTPFLDETAAELADLVLPDHTFLERWEDAAPAPSVGVAVFGIRQPVVEPLHDTRASGDVVIQLAGAIGEELGLAFPFADFKDAVKRRVVGIFRAKSGSIVEEEGAEFLRRLFEQGYWTDDAYPFEAWDEVLRTPSGRFEFFSQELWRTLGDAAAAQSLEPRELLERLGVDADPEELCMPHHAAARWSGDAASHALLLVPYKPNTYAEGGGANLPWLQELVLHSGRRAWETEAELHPRTARDCGVADGDLARVSNAVGSIVVRVHLSSALGEGVVRVPKGGGHTAFGRFAQGRGANPQELISVATLDPLFGTPPQCGTRVTLSKEPA
jgi:anaerobic selenocysteine-containing dehydrogenase